MPIWETGWRFETRQSPSPKKKQKLGENSHFSDSATKTENRQFSMGNGKYVTSVFRSSHCGVESDSPPQWRGAGPRKRTGYMPSVGRGLRCPPFSGFDPTYIPFFSSATRPFFFGRRFLFFYLLRVFFQRAPVAPNPMVFFFLVCLCGPRANRPLLGALVWGRR